jgi:Heavy metal associated domain 2
MKLQDIRLVHAIPGRVRFRIDTLKGRPEEAEKIQQALATVRGMLSAEASPVTGSVLAQFDPALTQSFDFYAAVGNAVGVDGGDLEASQLSAWYAQQGNGSNPSTASGVGVGLQRVCGTINSELAKLMDGAADLRTLIPLGLFLLGFRSLLVADKLPFPSWYDYWWFAFGSYFILNNPNITTKQ